VCAEAHPHAVRRFPDRRKGPHKQALDFDATGERRELNTLPNC
jgi:hypothetical protein